MDDGGPSVTARLVAAHRLGFSRVPAAKQFRQVAAVGSRLAISVSLSREHDEGARARFQAAVAALGEPARSTLDAGQAEDLLARTGWRAMLGREETTAKRQRLRSAGLLMASAGPQAPAPSERSKPSKPSLSPAPSALRPGSLPLSALLSQVLVAYTIEFDNEAEHRLPHRTTDHGASGHGDGPWLASLVMWENCLRHVTDQPITVAELETRARTGTNLDGMRRWGYVTIDGTAEKIYQGRPGPDAVLRATAAGLRAREVWLPLSALIEQRWHERFTGAAIGALRTSLEALASGPDGEPTPMFRGLEPYPDNWRAAVRRPATLPHYPMVLHRGGYPDGS